MKKTNDIYTLETCELCGTKCNAVMICDEGIACEVCADRLMNEDSPCTLPEYDSDDDWIF